MIILNKKGEAALEQLQSVVAPLIAVAIVLVVGFLIMAQTKDQVESMQGSSWCDENYTYRPAFNQCENTSSHVFNGPGNRSAGTSYAYNSTSSVQIAMDGIPGWLPIIIVAIIGSILLGLVAYFRSR